MTDMQGSYEARTRRVEDAARDLLREILGVADDEHLGVIIKGTFDDQIIVCAYHGIDSEDQTYRIPYQLGEDGEVSLGEPQPVDLKVVWTPDQAPDGAEPEPPPATEYVGPAIKRLDDATTMLTVVGRHEGKGLTDQHRDELAAAATRLLDALSTKNMGVANPLDDEDVDADPEAAPADAAPEPPPPGEDDENDTTDDDDEMALTPEQVEADLASIAP